jgi:tetratricopeptide (TPR) repeat protein
MHIKFCFVVIATLVLVEAPAFAEPAFAAGRSSTEPDASSKDKREREARKACLVGDYAKGVLLLSDLFLDFKDPNYIFNQGRCYEQNQQFEEAIKQFREYLRISAEDPTLAEKHIAECEALQREKTRKAAPPSVKAKRQRLTELETTSQRIDLSVPSLPSVEKSITQAPSPGSGLRTSGVVVAGFGVASAITGLVLNLIANSRANKITPPNLYERSKEATRQDYENLGWVSYGVGALATATGAVLYGVGVSKGRIGEVALIPAIGQGVAGASLHGAF